MRTATFDVGGMLSMLDYQGVEKQIGRMAGVRWILPTVPDRFLTLQDRLRASQGRLDAPWIVLPGAGRSRLRVRSSSNACPSPESPYPAWRAQALRRIINAGSYAVRPPRPARGARRAGRRLPRPFAA